MIFLLQVFLKTAIALAQAARVISAFWKTNSRKLGFSGWVIDIAQEIKTLSTCGEINTMIKKLSSRISRKITNQQSCWGKN